MERRRDLSGQVLDNRYRVIGRVGKGNMGSVYRAEDIKLGRVVAVKVINEQVPNEMAARQRFDREAKAMAKLEHPHCASVLDVGMVGDQPFVVMDFVAGQGLDELVAEGPLPIARAVEVTRQVLFGLAHAHECGIIHRDIKPANIVLSQKSGMGDHAMILDFGLAKLNLESSGGANLTSGVVVGTPSYMAPEQIRGLLIDHRVDIYACGILLFELLTGIKPFRVANNEPIAICMAHLNEPAPRLADVSGGRDFGALEAVVAAALAKDRDHRFASANAFANALSAALATPKPPILPASKPSTLPRQSAEPTSALSTSDLEPAASGVATMALAATDIAAVDRISPTPTTGILRADPVSPPGHADRLAQGRITPPGGARADRLSPLRLADIDRVSSNESADADRSSPTTDADRLSSDDSARADRISPPTGIARRDRLSSDIGDADRGMVHRTPPTGIAHADRISPPLGVARADRSSGTAATDIERSSNDMDRSSSSQSDRSSSDDPDRISPTPASGFVPPRRSRRWLAILGVVAVAAAVVVVVVARDSGSRSATPGSSAKLDSPTDKPTVDKPPIAPDKSPPDKPGPDEPTQPTTPPTEPTTPPVEPTTPPTTPPADDAVATILARAEGLVATGRREAAIAMLTKARKTHPTDGRLPYRAGLLYLDRMWWPDGIKQLRAAIELDPSYKTDSRLIQAALHAFNSTAWVDWALANFLRNDIGPAVKPYLEDAAKNHRNPVVRQRDAAELRRY